MPRLMQFSHPPMLAWQRLLAPRTTRQLVRTLPALQSAAPSDPNQPGRQRHPAHCRSIEREVR
jgi:hypothetical protein